MKKFVTDKQHAIFISFFRLMLFSFMIIYSKQLYLKRIIIVLQSLQDWIQLEYENKMSWIGCFHLFDPFRKKVKYLAAIIG